MQQQTTTTFWISTNNDYSIIIIIYDYYCIIEMDDNFGGSIIHIYVFVTFHFWFIIFSFSRFVINQIRNRHQFFPKSSFHVSTFLFLSFMCAATGLHLWVNQSKYLQYNNSIWTSPFLPLLSATFNKHELQIGYYINDLTSITY